MKKTIICITAFLISLFVIIPLFSACNNNEEKEEQTSDIAVESEIESDKTEQTDPNNMLIINSENIKTAALVRVDNLDPGSAELSLFSAFKKELKDIFGSQPTLATDFVKKGYEPKEAPIEIVMGDTQREASKIFNDKLKALGTPAYGISVSEGKICVSGTSVYLTYLAIDRLLKDYITTDEVGASQLSIEPGTELIVQAESDYPNPSDIINSGRKYAFHTIERLAKIPAKDGYSGVQGGGTDGEFAYFASINTTTAPGTAIIRKYDMTTWEIVDTSDPIPSEHSNDIAYDPVNDRLVISTCVVTDDWRGLVFLKRDTLEFIEYKAAGAATRGIAYLPKTNGYLFAVTYGYTLLNDKFEVVSSFDDRFPNLTTQGLDCDGEYIYDPRWDASNEDQTVVIHTLDGKFVDAVWLFGIEGEPENIMRDGNSFIMACNGSNAIYRIALMYENWWD